MKKNLLAMGVLSLAILGGSLAVAAAGVVGPAGAQTPRTAEEMVTDSGRDRGPFHRFREHRREIRKHTLQLTADTIGISTDELKSELKAGKSIADVATEHGVDPQAVIDTIVDDVNGRVDQAVADGKIDQAKGDKIKDRAPEVVTRVVNHVFER